jgi:hypothetical protein
MDFDTKILDQFKQFGAAGIPVLLFVFYQIYRLWKGDRKADTVDARIDAYSQRLQIELDKMGGKLDDLQKIRDGLVKENAAFSAQLTQAQLELSLMKDSANRHVDRIRYLEGLLKEKGISFSP